jgi:predicted cupin superfamily sugar epimerase
VNDRARELIRAYRMRLLPGEDTYVCELYRSAQTGADGLSALSAIYGLYCTDPPSHSNFHRLTRDEVWSHYEGDPIELFLLYPDGQTRRVVLGPRAEEGQVYQFTVPAGVWQGGRLVPGGVYALYGCTVAPAFTPECFRLGSRRELSGQYPSLAEVIAALSPP